MQGAGSELGGTEVWQRGQENRDEAVTMGDACCAWLCAPQSKAGNPWGSHGMRSVAGSREGDIFHQPRANTGGL